MIPPLAREGGHPESTDEGSLKQWIYESMNLNNGKKNLEPN